MGKHIFPADLSVKGIEDLKKQLLEYRDNELPRKIRMLVERLAEIGVESAKANVASLDAVFTGELYRSIFSKETTSSKDNVVFVVVADSQHAVFVEFGTGIIGKETPYIGEFPDGLNWDYASGKTIRQLADGRYGWFYPRDGQWFFTEGMPSRPFMYMASMDIRNSIMEEAKKIFKN